MRAAATSPDGDFSVRIIAGTRTVLMALNCPDSRRSGLKGFAFWREANDNPATGKWLRSLKVFKSVVPDPKAKVNGRDPIFRTNEHPIQSFLWSDYTAEPRTKYRFRIVPMYGEPGALQPVDTGTVTVDLETEPERDPEGHSIWFNRGAIASQLFAREFGDILPTEEQLDNPDEEVTKWLSRGLLEACLQFINEVPAGEGMRACVYEFTYRPVLDALKAALDRGVDLRISYHATTANEKAIEAAKIPKAKAGRKVLFPRTVPKIPHNKFIVRLDARAAPVSVWTGSTNITVSGFLGQSNVGHWIADQEVAATYLRYWQKISRDPARDDARKASVTITPHPPELPAPKSKTVVFSPRYRAAMLDWYANRMLDAGESIMFTAAFGVNKKLVGPLARERDFLRFVLMEKRPSREAERALREDKDLIISYGAVLGQIVVLKNNKRETVRIKNFQLDKWFEKEEHFRKTGNIFFVHTKFLLVDPLSGDPLVCTGSANFSDDSLTANDENMLLIRGDTRVADIYLTEFDRIFRHFYFRDVANEIEQRGGEAEGAFLDETPESKWTDAYFTPGAFKTRRREMFYTRPAEIWVDAAARRPKNETAGGADLPGRAPRKKVTVGKGKGAGAGN